MTAFVYEPKGKAKEYANLALNIYSGCPHGCTYCYVPSATFRDRATFHGACKASQYKIKPGKGAVLLCFTSDPYPNGKPHHHTREAIMDLHLGGYRPIVLTKNPKACLVDADLLKKCNAMVGTTISCWDAMASIEEPGAPPPSSRMKAMKELSAQGIITWVSVEPVMEPEIIHGLIANNLHIDLWKFGKLNHVKNTTDWKAYAYEVESIIKQHCKRWLVKNDLWAQRKDWGIPQSCKSSFEPEDNGYL